MQRIIRNVMPIGLPSCSRLSQTPLPRVVFRHHRYLVTLSSLASSPCSVQIRPRTMWVGWIVHRSCVSAGTPTFAVSAPGLADSLLLYPWVRVRTSCHRNAVNRDLSV